MEREIMSGDKKGCTFLWLIENYSYCWHENGERLISPEFTADCLEGTAWYLVLYPRGYMYDTKCGISLYLYRSNVDEGLEEISLMHELSLLDSTLDMKGGEISFRKGEGVGYNEISARDVVLSHRKVNYLHPDTLRVMCKLWRGEGNFQQLKQIVARTRIGMEQMSFLHVTESFSALEPNEKKTVQLRSNAKNGLALSSSLYHSDDSIIVEITPSDPNRILARCKISLLDSSGRVIGCCDAKNVIDASRYDIQKLSLSLTRQVILDKKSVYLPDDKLSLQCECFFSTGVELEKIERTFHDLPMLALNQLTDNDLYDAAEKLSACPSALDDFKVLYNNQLLTDVEIKTKTKSFPAHKNVLCARSSVFKSMLTNDMKEKITNCVEVDDLENDIVQQLLSFLYSDSIENLTWESAIRLYYARDKYDIEKLKLVCASFLLKNLSSATASELLLLADTHNDSDLKKTVENFIFKHEEQVYGSEEWRNLIETHPLLVSQTMCLMHMRNSSWNQYLLKPVVSYISDKSNV